VSHDSYAGAINVCVRVARQDGQQMIEKKAHVRHTTRDHSFKSGRSLLVGLIIGRLQLRCDNLRVIHGGDNVAMAT
jgi:hypothetical protein